MTAIPSPSTHPTEQDPRWAQVLARDSAADGRFVFSVRTTGVYCRPSCPCRRPLPRNVRFFTGPRDAEQAGFRPCKRCRPNGPSLAETQAAAIARACRTIDAAEEPPSLAQLAKAARMSPYHFHRVFKAATGVTPKAYAEAGRSRRLREALPRTETVTEALYDAGYGSSGRFYAGAKESLGMTPTRYRAGGVGAVIRFALGESSLGTVLVARSEVGICAILLGDDPDALLRNLQDRFPRAELIGGDPPFEALVATVVGLVEEPRRGLDLPLDLRGTAFQRRVWEALRAIPPGQTATYAEIARRIGSPAGVRAVAGACAANALAVAVPCHRVVRTDGSLSGYRWGVDRKRELLTREKAA